VTMAVKEKRKALTESAADRKKRVRKMLSLLRRAYPIGKRTALDHAGAVEMVVATILSAQCTDKQVNLVTPALFARYRSAADYAGADVAELEGFIRSTGFYHNKAKNIIACCRDIVEKHAGEVPRDVEALTKLPGIGRKTANVIKYAVWGDNDGIAVDTHVGRLSRRLGLSAESDPAKVEKDLLDVTPPAARGEFSWMLIQHGRNVCDARRPACERCMIAKLCPSAGRAADIK